MPESLFNVGNIYRRSLIHDQYGGNRQSGISVSAENPYIFIFSGQSGHQHGYKDQWENENVFSYTGEGQAGDMQFVRGNLALKEHIEKGKRVFLFIQSQKAFVTFETELELIDFDFFQGIDRDGKNRESIKFFFKRVGIKLEYEKSGILHFQESEANYKIKRIPNETERKGLVTSRIGQGAYRKSVLFRWDFKCAVTNYNKADILIASHIVPWKDATNEERLDVDNGILLSPNYDALFDQHLISFENNGKIILSKSLLNSKYEELGVTGKEVIINFSSGNKTFLEKHREFIG